MVPHAGQRPAMKVSAVPAAGLKRKAPTTKGKGVASADPGRLQHGKARRTPEGMTPKPSARQCNAGAVVKDGAGTAKGGTPAEDGKGKGKGKRKSDIDDIFAGVKRLKEQKAEEEAQRVAKKKKMKEEHKRRQANPFTGEGGPEKRWAWADDVKPVRFDDEGLPIYTWDSLRIGQGGGTALCPFDCDCCF